ncbi:MAG: hypothetical protein AB7D29_07575 [Campylobacterales bacterium]
MKYTVLRRDGRDNTGEKYIVLRIDKNSKTHKTARKAAQVYIDAMKDTNPQAYTAMSLFLNEAVKADF